MNFNRAEKFSPQSLAPCWAIHEPPPRPVAAGPPTHCKSSMGGVSPIRGRRSEGARRVRGASSPKHGSCFLTACGTKTLHLSVVWSESACCGPPPCRWHLHEDRVGSQCDGGLPCACRFCPVPLKSFGSKSFWIHRHSAQRCFRPVRKKVPDSGGVSVALATAKTILMSTVGIQFLTVRKCL